MHSRIFQVTKDPANAEPISEERYYEWDLPDYTDRLPNDRIGDQLDDWMSGRTGLDVDAVARTIEVTDKLDALRPYYRAWLDGMRKAASMSFEEFTDSWPFNGHWHAAKSAFDEELGLYFDDNDEEFGLMTIQGFLRNSSDGDVWHVVGVLDYHF